MKPSVQVEGHRSWAAPAVGRQMNRSHCKLSSKTFPSCAWVSLWWKSGVPLHVSHAQQDNPEFRHVIFALLEFTSYEIKNESSDYYSIYPN